jgi:GST-like protein
MAKEWPGGPVLYHGEPNGPSLSVLAALEESGLEIECFWTNLRAGERHGIRHDRGMITDPVPSNHFGIEDFVAADFSVEGEGPFLVIDGEAMADAVFLAQFLDEKAQGCGLQPAEPYARWQMRMWCRQVTERLAPAAAYLGNLAYTQAWLAEWNGQDFYGMSLGIVSEDLRARWQELRDGAVDDAKVADSKAKVAQFAERIETQLGDGREWLMGAFSIADLETFAWLRSMRELEGEAFAGRERCLAWMDRVEARPSVQAALARATTDTPEHAFAPGPEINRWG